MLFRGNRSNGPVRCGGAGVGEIQDAIDAPERRLSVELRALQEKQRNRFTLGPSAAKSTQREEKKISPRGNPYLRVSDELLIALCIPLMMCKQRQFSVNQ